MIFIGKGAFRRNLVTSQKKHVTPLWTYSVNSYYICLSIFSIMKNNSMKKLFLVMTLLQVFTICNAEKNHRYLFVILTETVSGKGYRCS